MGKYRVDEKSQKMFGIDCQDEVLFDK